MMSAELPVINVDMLQELESDIQAHLFKLMMSEPGDLNKVEDANNIAETMAVWVVNKVVNRLRPGNIGTLEDYNAKRTD